MVSNIISEEKLKERMEKQRKSKIKVYKKYLINKKENNIYLIRNRNLGLIRVSNRKVNCIRIGSESLDHAIEKLKVCYELQKLGHHYITEGIFENGSRCDILNLDTGEIFEVLKSEKLEDCRNKVMSYPKGLKLRYVEIKDV